MKRTSAVQTLSCGTSRDEVTEFLLSSVITLVDDELTGRCNDRIFDLYVVVIDLEIECPKRGDEFTRREDYTKGVGLAFFLLQIGVAAGEARHTLKIGLGYEESTVGSDVRINASSCTTIVAQGTSTRRTDASAGIGYGREGLVLTIEQFGDVRGTHRLRVHATEGQPAHRRKFGAGVPAEGVTNRRVIGIPSRAANLKAFDEGTFDQRNEHLAIHFADVEFACGRWKGVAAIQTLLLQRIPAAIRSFLAVFNPGDRGRRRHAADVEQLGTHVCANLDLCNLRVERRRGSEVGNRIRTEGVQTKHVYRNAAIVPSIRIGALKAASAIRNNLSRLAQVRNIDLTIA